MDGCPIDAQPKRPEDKKPAAHRVPPEVLSSIFAQLVPPQAQKESDQIVFPKMAEILLPGRVCRPWRDAAVATPILWSSLSFDLDPRFTEKVTEIGRICLERAKNHSLSIQLRDARDGEPCHPIIPMLLTRAHQWYNLCLRTSPSVCPELLDARGRITHLRRLDVGVTGNPRTFDTFEISPQLRATHLHFPTPTATWNIYPCLPWSQLQHISFEGSALHCFRIISLAPNLLTFSASTIDRLRRPDFPVCSHAHLRKLTVDARKGSDLLAYLLLPALMSLDYKGSALGVESFITLVQRSGIGLSFHELSLTITGSNHSRGYGGIVQILHQYTPDLVKLSVSDFRLKENLWMTSADERVWPTESKPERIEVINEAYTTTPDSPTPCLSFLPKLRHLVLSGPWSIDYSLVLDLVESRWRGIEQSEELTRLECIEINHKPCAHGRHSLTPFRAASTSDERALAVLRLYRAEGLRVLGPAMDGYA
ncbi:hypothetical protein HWV62_29529 [Athelia sp. TMB]|nr:hypothetical protein HWV62_29529 [Athelia sp. TMB]